MDINLVNSPYFNKIKGYIPYNEQEERDQEYMLKFIDSFDDVLTRNNIFGQFTASGFVVNKERTKLLLVYHNIYGGYIFPGGHMDGETDFLSVATREIEEETGVIARPISDEIFSVWVGPCKGHIKRESYVSAHIHLDLAYLFEADDSKELKVKPDENQSVIWADFNEIGKTIKLVDFFEPIYEKFLEKIKNI